MDNKDREPINWGEQQADLIPSDWKPIDWTKEPISLSCPFCYHVNPITRKKEYYEKFPANALDWEGKFYGPYYEHLVVEHGIHLNRLCGLGKMYHEPPPV